MAGLNAKVMTARLVGAAVRRSGRGGGTSLPGKVLIRLDRNAIGALAARLPAGSAVISATNGKTTTAAMAASILAAGGTRLVHNRSGANMSGGIASTLIEASRGRGLSGDLGLFEVDEFWLGQVVAELQPRAVLLSNLFRDQLDRYGELDTIADRWAAIATAQSGQSRLVLNADDPLIADLGREATGVTYFGLEDGGVALATMQHAADSTHCRHCGTPYEYAAVYLGHLGLYRCPGCGNERPAPTVAASEVALAGTRGASFTLSTPIGATRIEITLPGLYNVYNALGAAALCLELGATLEQIRAGLAGTAAAFGRGETVVVDGTDLQLLLIKNPAGANEVLRTLALEAGELDLLGILNDQIADGRDVSWIWDADWELLAPKIRTATCSGSRAAELALRLKYAGVPRERLTVIPALGAALDHAVAEARAAQPTVGPESGEGRPRLYAVPTYTAMLALRGELTSRGHVDAYWQEAA
jgi:lipid II isoglutaminyl synthase (glutamine-hydrolysing)